MMVNKKYIFGLLLLIIQISGIAQNKILISGSLIDGTTNETLPFATVSLKKHLIGTITNESGRFDLYIPENAADDTLQINNLGYKTLLIALKTLQSPVTIKLQQEANWLNEIVIKPQRPEFYIKLAVLCIKNNYPNKPFQTEAYYREKILENKNFIMCNEGVFKTYCPNYLDTVKNQDQLLLFREEKDIHEIAFMSEERKESEEKERKRAEKENEKNRKKGITKEVKPKKGGGPQMDIVNSFGGPETILSMGDITNNSIDFLDTTKFNDYKYTFAKSSSYNSNELIVIDVKSKGKIDHVRSSGIIYIDAASYAIVKIESTGDFIIPILIRPLLFLYGLGIENPTMRGIVEFQQIQKRWYPKNIQFNVNINLSNKHWFAPDEHSNFSIEGIYTVNKMKIDNVLPIPLTKCFNSKKAMKDQMHNDEGITWDQINIIKK